MSLTTPTLFFLFFEFIALPFCVIAQQIPVPAFLSTDSSPWDSPSGDFAFGFRDIGEANYLLSIWYKKIPDTIVWYAGLDGVLAPKGSKLTISADRGLVLNDPQGKELWNPLVSGTLSYCLLNDTGNLVVKDTDDITRWQSFDDPRDTLLPTQTMSLGAVSKIYSKRSETNFARGKFELRLLHDGDLHDGDLHDGDLVLNTRSLVADLPYDATFYRNTNNDPSNSGYTVSYDVTGSMYILSKNGSKVSNLVASTTFPSHVEDFYFRATLNFYGSFTWYYHKREATTGSSSWSVLTSQPENVCAAPNPPNKGITGFCGFNSICNIDSGDHTRPNCTCPPRYSLLDSEDEFGGCKPDFLLGCEGEIGYTMEMVQGVDWPFLDYDTMDLVTEDQCKKSCLDDSFCSVVILNNSTKTCWKKKLPLSNGKLDDTRTAFLKVSNVDGNNTLMCRLPTTLPPIPNVRKHRKGMTMNPMVSTFMGTSIFLNLVLFGAILGIGLFFRRRQPKVPCLVNTSLERWNNIRCFSYKELSEATDGFKEELGRGACAIVYKGTIAGNVDGTKVLVAVKKIDRTLLREADKEFKAEASVIGQTHHKNLVRLIGFCEDEEHRLLVYELMKNGCLANFLFGEKRPSWVERVRIAQGIARGILYLHEECGNQIIHCDIKPQNILLDEYFEARISDFGLSKLMMLNQFQTQTGVRGTKGYVAPEWFRGKPVTVKVDVYSFGVLLFEIITCRRCINLEASEEERVILTDWAFECYQSGDMSDLLDGDMEALDDKVRLDRFLKAAIWCIQEDPNLRPTMRQVSLMLEGVVEVPPPPLLNPYSFNVSIPSDDLICLS